MSSTTSTATPPGQRFDALLDEVKVSKSDFNHLILDYFVSNGYPEAAQKFAQEANMQPAPDVATITRRVEIRHAIHSGDIQTAIEKINEYNPQLLEANASLHFALLRLQLIELIRTGNSQANGDVTPALDFATAHLAPRAPTNPNFLSDLEQTMALLIFRQEDLTPPLAELLEPSLRQDVARQVNEALLVANGDKAMATLADLIAHRAWSHQKVLKSSRDVPVPESIDLGLDPPKSNAGGGHGSAEAAGVTDADSMATGWDGQS